MCKNEADVLPPIPEISHGAALAHGCCGGFRPPVSAPKATVIPFAKAGTDCRGDCADEAPTASETPARQAIDLAALTRIRQIKGVSQVELAGRLNVSQPHIAQIEQQTDMLLSTLDRHILALGGELHLIARFPEGSFNLKAVEESA